MSTYAQNTVTVIQFLLRKKQEKDERSGNEVESQALTVLWSQAKGWQGIGIKEEVRKRCALDEGKRVGTFGVKSKE